MLYAPIFDDMQVTLFERQTRDSTVDYLQGKEVELWKNLDSIQQAAARQMGFDEESWNQGIFPHRTNQPWDTLDPWLRRAALVLGYDSALWNTELSEENNMGGSETPSAAPPNPTWRWELDRPSQPRDAEPHAPQHVEASPARPVSPGASADNGKLFPIGQYFQSGETQITAIGQSGKLALA